MHKHNIDKDFLFFFYAYALIYRFSIQIIRQMIKKLLSFGLLTWAFKENRKTFYDFSPDKQKYAFLRKKDGLINIPASANLFLLSSPWAREGKNVLTRALSRWYILGVSSRRSRQMASTKEKKKCWDDDSRRNSSRN